MRKTAIVLCLLAVAPPLASAARLKELVEISGVRQNQLIGMGLVVGLAGTGDDASSALTRREIAAMAKRLGLTLDPTEIKAKNVAAVMVTAELPAFARSGKAIDVTVASMGSAKSLGGGTLLMTPLKGPDLGTYALAQGQLLVAGFSADGASGSSSKKNHTTVAHIPGGARVERDAPGVLGRDEVVLILRDPDFTTAARIATAIDNAIGAGSARVRDPGAVEVAVTGAWKGRVVQLVATLESLEASPDAPARVIIDERSGTIVAGAAVTLSKAAIAHGGLQVTVNEAPTVSQPGPLGAGQTVVAPKSEVKVEEQDGKIEVIQGAATVGDVAAALNALGAKPRDLAAIFQALKAAGALHAELTVL